MPELLAIVTLPSRYMVVRIPSDESSPQLLGDYRDHDSAREVIRLTAQELGAEAVEMQPDTFALRPTDDPDNVLAHEWTPEH